MTQRERDRLLVLKKLKKRLIRQSQAAEELGITIRHVKRLLRRLKAEGDKSVLYGLRGRPSARKRSAGEWKEIVRILSQEVYRGFGPTLTVMGPEIAPAGTSAWTACVEFTFPAK